jgi:hypothetical protein
MIVITNMAGYNGRTQRIDDSVFPRQMRDMIREKFDLEDAILGEGIGMLESMAGQGTQEHQLIPPWSTFIADTLNKINVTPGTHVAEVYWSVSNASLQGILVRIRTALADMVAELITLTPQDQEVPDRLAADQAIQFVITGDRPTIHFSSQHAADGGTNVTVAESAPGPVVVSGAHGTAIGSQTASGPGSSVTGSQAAAGANSIVAGSQSLHAGTARTGRPRWAPTARDTVRKTRTGGRHRYRHCVRPGRLASGGVGISAVPGRGPRVPVRCPAGGSACAASGTGISLVRACQGSQPWPCPGPGMASRAGKSQRRVA